MYFSLRFIGGLYGRLIGRAMVDLFGIYTDEGSYWNWMDPGAFALIGAASFFGGVSRLTMSLTVIMVKQTTTYFDDIMISLSKFCVSVRRSMNHDSLIALNQFTIMLLYLKARCSASLCTGIYRANTGFKFSIIWQTFSQAVYPLGCHNTEALYFVIRVLLERRSTKEGYRWLSFLFN